MDKNTNRETDRETANKTARETDKETGDKESKRQTVERACARESEIMRKTEKQRDRGRKSRS